MISVRRYRAHYDVIVMVKETTPLLTYWKYISGPHGHKFVFHFWSCLSQPPALSYTHSGILTPHGDTDRGQHWLGQWLFAWRHKAITWTNVDLSSKVFCGIRLWVISHEVIMNIIRDCNAENISIWWRHHGDYTLKNSWWRHQMETLSA